MNESYLLHQKTKHRLSYKLRPHSSYSNLKKRSNLSSDFEKDIEKHHLSQNFICKKDINHFVVFLIALALTAVSSDAFSASKSSFSFISNNRDKYHSLKGNSGLFMVVSQQDQDQERKNMDMNAVAKLMKERASTEHPFTEEEIEGVLTSFQSLLPAESKSEIDLEKLKNLLKEVPHLSHKQWDRTGTSSASLQDILLPSTAGKTECGLNSDFESVMERVLNEGNWFGAASAAVPGNGKPWAVLVTGVNGIRKTTSIYQPWFQDLLAEAIVLPKDPNEKIPSKEIAKDILPTGQNSFFRQLDHMITIIAKKEFENLYTMTNEMTKQENGGSKDNPSSEVIDSYARLKDAIFTRYRTLAEMLGILLLREASERNMNVMLETSGRDVAMFEYVNKFFSSDKYNKLVLHFTINDISFAEKSVDTRMTGEIKDGMDAMDGGSAQKVVYANKGGPYGSEVLKGVQSASDKVWVEKVIVDGGVADSWHKAEIMIEGSETEDWKAVGIVRGTNNEENRGKEYTFERR